MRIWNCWDRRLSLEADRDHAASFQRTHSQNDLTSSYDRYGLPVDYHRPLRNFVAAAPSI